jgi:ADP-heptose:LPS heptosyltransferase
MVFFSGASYTLGFCQQKSKYLYNVLNECAPDRLKEEQSLYNYMISIVEALSDKKFSLKPVFEVSEDEEKIMQKYLNSFGYERDKLYTLNLASSKEDKILEFEKYFFIVEYLYKNYGFVPAIVSNPSQEYLQERFVDEYMKNSDIPYIKLKPLSLGEVAAVIKLTRFIVTPDTGLMHLAMALDSYIFTIFTYTHPIFVDPENEKFIAVYERFEKGKLYQKQNISRNQLEQSVDILLNRLR